MWQDSNNISTVQPLKDKGSKPTRSLRLVMSKTVTDRAGSHRTAQFVIVVPWNGAVLNRVSFAKGKKKKNALHIGIFKQFNKTDGPTV